MSGLMYPKRRYHAAKRRTAQEKAAHWRQVVAAVKARDGWRCRCCGAHGTDPHHLVPRSLGGQDEVRAVCLLCRSCHDQVTHHEVRIEGGNANGTLRFVRSEWMR